MYVELRAWVGKLDAQDAWLWPLLFVLAKPKGIQVTEHALSKVNKERSEIKNELCILTFTLY
jgi:hypothetical protein